MLRLVQELQQVGRLRRAGPSKKKLLLLTHVRDCCKMILKTGLCDISYEDT